MKTLIETLPGPVQNTTGVFCYMFSGASAESAKALESRLIACKQACQGISDPEQLRIQRDELLAVVGPLLEAYYNMAQMLNPECQFGGDQLTQESEEAIAKATT